MIKVHQLSKTYGERVAISDLNFTVNSGEIVGFLGPNGAGKTTTMKIITGFMAASSGHVEVAGYDVFENPKQVTQKIGYLPEVPPLYPEMYVQDYLKFVARLRSVEKSKQKGFVDQAIDKTSLGDVKNRLIGNLSKGFRQRVGIAQALVSKPEILILDEPTVGLDPKQVAGIRDLLKSLKGDHTIILSTHILPEVQAICEKIIIINKGSIIAEDSLESLSQKMSGGSRLSVHVRQLPENLLANIKKMEGVSEATSEANNLLISLNSGDDLVDQIAQTIVQSGAGLLEFKAMDRGLEDIFIQLTK